MLTLCGGHARIPCQRRDFLRVGGGMAVAGLVLPETLSTGVGSAEQRTPPSPAKSCILVYLLGGPPHQDMFDLKAHAPAEIRGPFNPIATNLPGVQICELLPRLARMADKYALIRSVSHPNSNHTPMIYYTLTGFHTAQPNRDNDIRPPQRVDFPHMGAVLAKFKGSPSALPGYVAMPEVAIRSSTKGQYKRARLPLRGGGAGFLGAEFEALAVNGPPGEPDSVPGFVLPKSVNEERFEQRRQLLAVLDRGAPRVPSTEQLGTLRRRAVVLTGAANRAATSPFSLDDEPASLRDRYGRHRFGQTMLMARRLAEAHVPMVAVHFNEMTVCDGWDLHSKNFDALKTELLPMLDQGLSALLEDLGARGRLEETLVVVMGEFGRTPKINNNAGRDHWGECSSTLLAGGGIRGGQVLGSSDRNAAYPASDPVDPIDIQATIYRCMGLDPHRWMYDLSNRQWPLSNGKVLTQLL
jgi:hypothetical protein